MLINDRTVIVTGGASGLGEAVVRRLHADGANVIVGDMGEEGGKALEAELGARCLFAKCNVVDEVSVSAALGALSLLKICVASVLSPWSASFFLPMHSRRSGQVWRPAAWRHQLRWSGRTQKGIDLSASDLDWPPLTLPT